MPNKPVRALDPLGVIALANVLVKYGHPGSCANECSCEGKPGLGVHVKTNQHRVHVKTSAPVKGSQ